MKVERSHSKIKRRPDISSLILLRISHQLIGYEVANPQNIAICTMNQNSKLCTSNFAPSPSRKIRKIRDAMKPYIPIYHAARDNVSALTASRMPWPTESPRIGAIVKYWKMMPNA